MEIMLQYSGPKCWMDKLINRLVKNILFCPSNECRTVYLCSRKSDQYKTIPHTHTLQSSPLLLGYWTGTLDIHKIHVPWCGLNDSYKEKKRAVTICYLYNKVVSFCGKGSYMLLMLILYMCHIS